MGVTNWETRGTSIWPEAYYSKYTYTWNSRPFCDQDRKCINRRCICLYYYYCTVLEVPVRRVWKRKLEHENFRKNGETEIMWPRSGLRNLFVSVRVVFNFRAEIFTTKRVSNKVYVLWIRSIRNRVLLARIDISSHTCVYAMDMHTVRFSEMA